ncbi:hypothetical protein [Mycobacterium sp.]|uniref:hypothetical protein n=1 Tax=Mycobacterium sp. TaxID=1785 RepID=UPI003BA9A2F1
MARNAGYDFDAGQLHARRAEFLAARFHGHATGGYQRLTALLASKVEECQSHKLTKQHWALSRWFAQLRW